MTSSEIVGQVWGHQHILSMWIYNSINRLGVKCSSSRRNFFQAQRRLGSSCWFCQESKFAPMLGTRARRRMFQSGRSRSLLAKVTEESDFMNKTSPRNFINNAMTFTLGTSWLPSPAEMSPAKNSADSFNNFSSVITFSHARVVRFLRHS